MVCVICSSGKTRPAVCPPLRPLSVSLTLFHFITLPPPLSSSGNSPCVVSVHFCMCLFVCLCLLHNSWIWFVLLNLAMGLISGAKTHIQREGKREVSALVYFAVMSYREHKGERELTYVDDIFYMIPLLLYFATSGCLPINTEIMITKGIWCRCLCICTYVSLSISVSLFVCVCACVRA